MRERIPPETLYLILRSVGALAFALVLTYELAYHTITLGLSPLQLVIVGVVLECMTFLFEIPTGVFADLVSRRLSVIIGVLLTGIGFLSEILLPSFAGALLAQVLWGVGFTFYSGAEAAWITDEIGAERAGPLFMRATQLSQILAIVGTLLGALLASVSVATPIIAGASLYLLLGGALALTMAERGFQPAARAGSRPSWALLTQPLRDSAQLIRAHPLLWLILSVGFVIGASLGGFDRLYTAHFVSTVGLPDGSALPMLSWLGVISGAVSVLSLAGMEIVRRRHRSPGQATIMRLLVGLYGGIVAGGLLFALAGSFAPALVGFCIAQACRNVSRPLLLQWINLNAPRQTRATVISTYWQANALGHIAGTPALGWLAGAASLRAALSAGALLYVTTIPIVLAAQRRWGRAQQAPVAAEEP